MTRKNTKDKTYYGEVRLDILSFFPGKINSLLDIGCGEGLTSKYLKEKYNINHIAGIEIVTKVADKAKNNLDSVFNVDIEEIETFYEYFKKKYDCILLLDILEHLINPEIVLKKLDTILAIDGFLLISLPNVRHYRVIFPLLLRNEWAYTNAGPLDRTHLRFFTIKSMKRLLYDAGYEIIIVKQKKSYTRMFTLFNILFLGSLSSFSNLQYIFLCRRRKNGN